MESLTPGQQVVKIVHEELTELLGGSQSKLTISPQAANRYYDGRSARFRENNYHRKIGPSVEKTGQTSTVGSL